MIRESRGLSLLGLIGGLAIASGILLGLSFIFEHTHKTVNQYNLNHHLWQASNRIAILLNDDTAWNHTLNDGTNVSLSCLRPGSPVCGPGAGGAFNLRDKDNQTAIDTINPTAGFNRMGMPCTGFSPSEDSACPLRIELTWRPVCTSCANPQIAFEVTTRNRLRTESRLIYKNLQPLTGGLVLHLRFEGAAGQPLPLGAGQIIDSSGLNNHGTLVVNSVAPNFTASPVGTGLRATSTSYIEVPDAASLRINGPLTISTWAWFNPQPGLGGQWWALVARHNVNLWDSYAIRVYNRKVYFCVGETTATFCSQQDHPFLAMTWYHLVGVWDGSSMVSYVNGVRGPSLAFAGPIVYTNSPILITAENQDGNITDGSGFEKRLDEVRVWNRALSSAEIMNMYLAERP